MSGKVIEIPGRKQFFEGKEEGIKEGKEEGKEEGIKAGQTRMAELCSKLVNDNRLGDIKRINEDLDYREKLFNEYKL